MTGEWLMTPAPTAAPFRSEPESQSARGSAGTAQSAARAAEAPKPAAPSGAQQPAAPPAGAAPAAGAGQPSGPASAKTEAQTGQVDRVAGPTAAPTSSAADGRLLAPLATPLPEAGQTLSERRSSSAPAGIWDPRPWEILSALLAAALLLASLVMSRAPGRRQ